MVKKLIFAIASVFILFGCSEEDVVLQKKDDMYIVRQSKVDLAENRPNIYVGKNVGNLPVVAVLLGLYKSSGGDPFYYVHEDYVKSLRAAGLYPMFVPYVNVGQWIKKINPVAIMTVGGAFGDFHDSTIQWFNDEDDIVRAVAYKAMIDYAKNYSLPYLGICAGAQELGISLNGKLHVNVNAGMPKIFHNNGNTHSIKIKEDSLLQSIVKKAEIDVNSYHNSVLHLPSGGDYRVSAVSSDGSIEAIEPLNPWNEFVLGVQWHPEKNAGACKDENPNCKIFRAFADAAKKYMLTGGRQQIRVNIPDTNDSRAIIEMYHNNQLIKSFDGFVGAAGGTTVKTEGDMKTPIGTFDIKRAFGTEPIGNVKIPYQIMGETDEWCDDPKSKRYNSLIAGSASPGKSGEDRCGSFEKMKRTEYKYGFVIEYNTEKPKPWAGSAIFFHTGIAPTAGCVVIPEEPMLEIIKWLDPAKFPEIRILSPNADGFFISHIPLKMRAKYPDPDMRRLVIKFWGNDKRIRIGEIFVQKEKANAILERMRKSFKEKKILNYSLQSTNLDIKMQK